MQEHLLVQGVVVDGADGLLPILHCLLRIQLIHHDLILGINLISHIRIAYLYLIVLQWSVVIDRLGCSVPIPLLHILHRYILAALCLFAIFVQHGLPLLVW